MTHDCECNYHTDPEGYSGDDCENEGTIKVPGYGWLCATCYDQIDDALRAYFEEHANGY